MKFAVLSDIHGNLPALKAVTDHIAHWRPDQVIVNGDVISRGPTPHPCWHFVQAKIETDGWRVICGNHEAYVIENDHPNYDRSGARGELNYMSYWTYQKLNRNVAALKRLPERISFNGPDGGEVRFRHATRDSLSEFLAHDAPPAQVRQKLAPFPALFLVANLHIPYVRQIDGMVLVNSGSVGFTLDEDRRASYAQLEWRGNSWRAKIIRLHYDYAAAARDMEPFLAEAGPVARIVHREWITARPMLGYWYRTYYHQIIAEEILLETSVANFLANT